MVTLKNKLDKNKQHANKNVNGVVSNGTNSGISVITGMNNFGMSLGMSLFKMSMKQPKE